MTLPVQIIASAAEFIASNEGFSPTVYNCSAKCQTIGYGFTAADIISKGKITKAEADKILATYAERCLSAVETLVTVKLTDNQKTVLADFIYQYGKSAFTNSTLLKKINNNASTEEINFEFRRWKYVRDGNGSKIVSPGLVNRNERRIKLYWK